jgi:4'-phosphopantetheinyl transferase
MPGHPALQSQSEPPSAAWATGPERPRLDDGVVHVWRADLDRVPASLVSVLSPSELERGRQIISERRRRRWMRSRAALRELLARYLGTDPRALRIATPEGGKPALDSDRLGMVRPAFSLSHSGRFALYAFSSVEIGVDLELPRRTVDDVSVAARRLGASQAERLAALEPQVRAREFRRAWVRYEARVKLVGGPLSGQRPDTGRGAPWVAELPLVARAGAAALASVRTPSRVLCFDLALARAVRESDGRLHRQG